MTDNILFYGFALALVVVFGFTVEDPPVMMIQFSIVGHPDRPRPVTVRMPAVPRVGDTVDIAGISQADTVVRTVVWYPFEEGEPMVYIVLGTPR